jgi:OmpA-OmpF porin, OOP family
MAPARQRAFKGGPIMLHRFALAALAISALACASSHPTPINAPVLVPGAHESVQIDQLVVLVDASNSVDKRTLFRDEKAVVESFARSMPKGNYETGSIAFGGFDRTTAPLEEFDRTRVVAEAAEIKHLDEGTPIHKAIAEASAALKGKRGTAAVVLYSDGQLTSEGGKELDPQLAIDAVKTLRKNYAGKVCLHTVQVGSDPEGGAFLSQLAGVTECGSSRTLEGVTTVASLQQFERQVFLGAETTPDVAAAPGDLDRDGVIDAKDNCPGTPRGAAVDKRGCWEVKGLRFATDSAKIDAKGKKALDEVAAVLKKNPKLRVQLDGHTDATATEQHNRTLSEQRAQAARSYLVAKGIEKKRLEAKGFGESKPAAENDTAAGRAQNRRTEIELID